jgi:flagellar basal body-associated protein FliL
MKKIYLILLILAAFMVAIVGYSIFSWTKAKSEVQQYCSQLSAGTSVEEAKSMALKRGLRFYSSQPPNSQGEYTALVTSSSVMGRYVCVVEHNGRTVTKARMQFKD